MQDRVVVDVGVVDGGEPDALCVARRVVLVCGLEGGHAREARQRGRGLLEVVDEHEQHADGVEGAVEVERRRGRLADGGVAGADEQEAGDQHARQPDQLAAVHRAPEAVGLQPGGPDRGLGGDQAGVADLFVARPPEAERAGGPRAGDRPDEPLRPLALLDPLARVDRDDVLEVVAQAEQLDRHRGQRGERQPRVERGQPEQRQPDEQPRLRELRHAGLGSPWRRPRRRWRRG